MNSINQTQSAVNPTDLEQMDTRQLLERYKQTGDMEAKWALVLRFTGLIRRSAAQVSGLYSSFAQTEDIISEGILVLLNAVDKFDLSKDVKFETYVSKRIRGMIIDLARRQDWLPRQVRQKAIRINRAVEELSMQLGRFPSSQEMADYLHVSREEYDEMLSDTAVSSLMSFEALLDAGSSGGSRLQPPVVEDSQPEELFEKKELHQILAQGIEQLREKERLVLSLYYEKELNMKEIAQVLGVSAPRVSQIHSRAIQHLKTYMKAYLEG